MNPTFTYESFDKSLIRHQEAARLLLELRNLPRTEYDYLPAYGYIAFVEHSPIAMGFMRPIDSRICMLDSYITNPSLGASVRDSALHGITTRLIELSSQEFYLKIIAFSEHKSLIDRICGQGFVHIPMDFAMINLTMDGDTCLFSEP